MSKLTDAKRFRLPYHDASKTARPGYLKKRMQQYREQMQAEAAQRVVPLKRVAK